MLVILTTTYGNKVLVIAGSKIINRAMKVITKGELARATQTWRQTHFCAVMYGLLQLSCKCTGEQSYCWGAPPSVYSGPTVHKEFCLDDVQRHVWTTQRIMIPLFGTVNIHGKIDGWGHCMWVHVLAEPVRGPQLPASVLLATKYWEVHQWFQWRSSLRKSLLPTRGHQ